MNQSSRSKRSRRNLNIARAEAGPRSLTRSQTHWQSAVGVFAAAVFVRLIVASQVWDLPIVRSPALDSAEYMNWAHRLAAGDFAWATVSQHAPGYPLFLAGLLTFGANLHTVLIFQALIGATTAAMLSVIGTRWFGHPIGLFGGLVCATYGPAVYHGS
jgi:hypothetical protein